MSRFSVHDNNVNINDRRPVSSRSLANRGLPVPPFAFPLSPCMPIRGPPLPRPAATCMIFRLGVRTCEPRLRAFIICFYARTSEEDCPRTRGRGIGVSHLAVRAIGNGRKARAEARRVEGEEGRREKRGHELSERNNISPEDLFTWRETLPSVSGSGSLP